MPDQQAGLVVTELESVFGRFPEVQLAFLLGSVAAGTQHCNSDIDVAVAAEEPLSAETKRKLIESIGDQTGRAVDLIDLNLAPQPILGEALAGTPIFSRSIDLHEKLITRAWDLEADFMPEYRAAQRIRLEEFAHARRRPRE